MKMLPTSTMKLFLLTHPTRLFVVMLELTGLLIQFTSTVKLVVLLLLVRSLEVTKRVTDSITLLVLVEELLGRSKTLLPYVVTVNLFNINVLSAFNCKTFINKFNLIITIIKLFNIYTK